MSKKQDKYQAAERNLDAGAADAEVMTAVADAWLTRARFAGIDLTGFDPERPLAERQVWARGAGLKIGCILSRFSTKLQQSTTDQATECATWAAENRIYVPPENVCVDEAVSGKKRRRDGLERMEKLMAKADTDVLLVYKLSRVFRNFYRGIKFFHEDIYENGKRGVAVSQKVDTTDERQWKLVAALHGISDELLLEAVTDHVRIRLKNMHQEGFVTGALTVGYDAIPVEGPRTKGNKPRTVPRPNERAAELIRRHYTWIAEGMSLAEGVKRWNRDGGPCDPRSTRKHMTYPAYRRMLSNPRYLGVWAFGRKKNSWSNRLDYNRPKTQADADVMVRRCEELRIVSDDLFHRVQAVLATKKGRPRGPRREKIAQLWDLVTHCFLCELCSAHEETPVRLYQAGANGAAMRCKNGPECRAICMVNRRDAVEAVCTALGELLLQDQSLVDEICVLANRLGESGDTDWQAEIDRTKRQLHSATAKLQKLLGLLGGSDDDDRLVDAEIRVTREGRAQLQVRLDQYLKLQREGSFSVTPEQVKSVIAEMNELLADGAAGKLADDDVHRAVTAFEELTGGEILVSCQPRPGRKRTTVKGAFRPNLIECLRRRLGDPGVIEETPSASVEVWLRSPPKCDLLAEVVHKLVDIDGLGLADADRVLREQGHRLHRNSVFVAYHRYYEMLGRPAPPLPYNNGNPRKRRS